jgi:hypothetical protein
MNFTPTNARLVMDGVKTQTRRKPHSKQDSADFNTIGDNGIVVVSQYTNGKWRKLWAVGDVIAVCPGRGKHAIGRARITKIRHEALQDITQMDAYRELGTEIEPGFFALPDKSREDFAKLWDSIYHGQAGKQWADNPYVFALTLEVVEAALAGKDD